MQRFLPSGLPERLQNLGLGRHNHAVGSVEGMADLGGIPKSGIAAPVAGQVPVVQAAVNGVFSWLWTTLTIIAHAVTSAAHTAGNWKVFYSNGSGAVVELALAATGLPLVAQGTTSAPAFTGQLASGIGVGRAAINALTVKAATNVVGDFTANGANLQLRAINDAAGAYVPLEFVGSQLIFSNAGLDVGGASGGNKGAGTVNMAAGAYNQGRELFALFDHYTDAGNVTTGETDLYSDTLPAALLANNGDKIEGHYGGVLVPHATATRQLRVYFAGSLIGDSGALSIAVGSDAWSITARIIRVSSSVVRCIVTITVDNTTLAAPTTYTEVTGLTLANTAIAKVTGTAAGVGAATGDITGKLGLVRFVPAA